LVFFRKGILAMKSVAIVGGGITTPDRT